MEEENEKKEETTKGPIEEARELAERIEEANKESRRILEAKEKLMAEEMLSGRADANLQREPPKEETPQEYAKRVMEGSV